MNKTRKITREKEERSNGAAQEKEQRAYEKPRTEEIEGRREERNRERLEENPKKSHRKRSRQREEKEEPIQGLTDGVRQIDCTGVWGSEGKSLERRYCRSQGRKNGDVRRMKFRKKRSAQESKEPRKKKKNWWRGRQTRREERTCCLGDEGAKEYVHQREERESKLMEN